MVPFAGVMSDVSQTDRPVWVEAVAGAPTIDSGNQASSTGSGAGSSDRGGANSCPVVAGAPDSRTVESTAARSSIAVSSAPGPTRPVSARSQSPAGMST